MPANVNRDADRRRTCSPQLRWESAPPRFSTNISMINVSNSNKHSARTAWAAVVEPSQPSNRKRYGVHIYTV
jgi:hypothetical protein